MTEWRQWPLMLTDQTIQRSHVLFRSGVLFDRFWQAPWTPKRREASVSVHLESLCFHRGFVARSLIGPARIWGKDGKNLLNLPFWANVSDPLVWWAAFSSIIYTCDWTNRGSATEAVLHLVWKTRVAELWQFLQCFAAIAFSRVLRVKFFAGSN